jgi:hypothetical protein
VSNLSVAPVIAISFDLSQVISPSLFIAHHLLRTGESFELLARGQAFCPPTIGVTRGAPHPKAPRLPLPKQLNFSV